jgi:AraC family transcriptional activator of pobA
VVPGPDAGLDGAYTALSDPAETGLPQGPTRFALAIPRAVASLAPMFETTRRPLAHSVSSLGKLRMQGAWKVELLHSAPRHRLYWITRGQGRISVNCITRGYGPNTAVFVPARAPMALELLSQTQGLELCLPPDDSLGLPDEPFHLRVSNLEAQGSLTSHLEKIERELAAQAPAMERALAAYSLLISVWMTRELARQEGAILRERSHRLVELFAERMEAQFRTGRGIARLRQAAAGHAHPSQPGLPGGRGAPRPRASDRAHHVRGAAAASGYRHARPRDRRASGLFLGGLFHARLRSGNGRTPSDFRAPARRA